MSSFDPDDVSTCKNSDVVKFPIKRIELTIKKFIKVLDIDLDRLHKHTINITRLTKLEDWGGLHREQVNAGRTIQQIKANIREIEKARAQVLDDDLTLFDEKVMEVKVKAVTSVEEFIHLVGVSTSSVVNTSDKGGVSTGHGDENCIKGSEFTEPSSYNRDSEHQSVTESTPLSTSNHNADNPDSSETQFGSQTQATKCKSNSVNVPDFNTPVSYDRSSTAYGSLPPVLTTAPLPLPDVDLHVVPESSAASLSWDDLQQNIGELNQLVHEFASHVEEQGEVINSIEDNIDSAHADVRQGVTNLSKASKYKAAMYPVVGALVGGVVGGPIGFVAGLKLGGLAGAVGGVVGYAGGRYMKKRQNTITELELQNLSDSRSISLPDIDDGNSRSITGETTSGESRSNSLPENGDVYSNQNSTFANFSVVSPFKRMFTNSESDKSS